MPSLREVIQQAELRLRQGPHPDRARQDAESLMRHLLGRDHAWLVTHWNEPIPRDLAAQFEALLARRASGEPIQYITGQAEFYGLSFRVTPAVLIPRPETEHLVEKVLQLAKDLDPKPSITAQMPSAPSIPRLMGDGWESDPAPARILDIGAGSGAIAIAIAHHLPQAQITAIDLSSAALDIARENAALNRAAIRFLQGDLLTPVAGERFDVIVSNPPYVPAIDRDSLSVEVRDHEPALALFAGSDGLDLYRRLIPAAFAALVPGGWLALEIGYGQSDAIAALLAQAGLHSIAFAPDLQGILRVAIARRP